MLRTGSWGPYACFTEDKVAPELAVRALGQRGHLLPRTPACRWAPRVQEAQQAVS